MALVIMFVEDNKEVMKNIKLSKMKHNSSFSGIIKGNKG